jgi:hypothetical protein
MKLQEMDELRGSYIWGFHCDGNSNSGILKTTWEIHVADFHFFFPNTVLIGK